MDINNQRQVLIDSSHGFLNRQTGNYLPAARESPVLCGIWAVLPGLRHAGICRGRQTGLPAERIGQLLRQALIAWRREMGEVSGH